MTPEEQYAANQRFHAAVPFLVDMLALWEVMNDALGDGEQHVPSLEALRQKVGTPELRDLCISINPYADAVWKAYEAAYGDFGGAYDWEFAPLLVSLIDWSKARYMDTPYHLAVFDLPSAADMAARIYTARKGTQPVPEIDLGERIQTALDTADDGIDGDRVARAYQSADAATRAVLDDVMISLCGWSIATMLKPEDPEPEPTAADYDEIEADLQRREREE